jgi:tetratricopeptide (TPR) repeat protein
MTRQKPQRDRSRILTPEGLQKLQARIREKEIQDGEKFTRQKISDLAGLHPDTVSKIFRSKEGVDRDSIQRLFCAFELELTESDLISTIQAGLPKPDPNFVGREEAIAELNTLVSQGKKVILVQAEGGVGKTTLAYRYLKTQGFDMVLELWMAKERQNITSIESVIEEWLKRYFDEEPGREFGVSLERLRCKLGDGSKKIGVLIDNLEPTLENGRFIEAHRRYAELLRILANPTVQSVTLITSRERLYEDGISVWLYPLSELPKEAWIQFFKTCDINTGFSPLSDTSALYQMHQAYGGNAEAMFVLNGAIQSECQGDLEAYWKENREDLLINPTLENLVKSQFNKLQQDDEQAYRLLCRLSCYRYQDVPSVPKEGIFYLLWDVPEERRKRVVKALRDRSLVKVCNEEYYLHPVIRAEAIARLRASEDWEEANHKAAEFWTESVETVETIEDALRGLEAYYQYLEISEFEFAGNVITKERDNKWEEGEALGRAFFRLGSLQQIIFLITRIINNLSPGYSLMSLYNILGASYWLSGQVHDAIEHHAQSGRIARKFEHKDYVIYSLLNIGLGKIDLWEIEEAVIVFREVEFLLENEAEGNLKEYEITPWYCLAFLNSYLGYQDKAIVFAEKAYNKLVILNRHQSIWGKSYGLLFLGMTYKNLEDINNSSEMYQQAISYAEETHYTQVKAKAITGLAELYRKKEDFETALSHHSESIELLYKIGAKCDLAESYYQQGLTYQKMGEAQKSQENFDKAIQLFSEIEAPKQVEKVRQSMESRG